jgi:glycerophosphoryl diester phosphodiesterase
MASVLLAARVGADAIELNATLSADEDVVVFHDATLERTTNGTGRLSQKSTGELRELDAGSHFSPEFRGEPIPLLGDIFEALGHELFINVELTNYMTPRDRLVEIVCDLVKGHSLQDRVIFSSFFAANLRSAERMLPGVPRGLLTRPGWRGAWGRSFGFSFGNYAALHPHMTDVNAPEVQRVHRLRRRVHVWTVNAPQDIKRLVEWGVDGIITDDPEATLQSIRRAA